jgi:hypothetical protein
VVELEHQRIILAAVDARTRAEELDEIGRTLGRHGLVASLGLLYVARAVRSVMLPLILGAALPAVVVPLSAGLTPPGKAVD